MSCNWKRVCHCVFSSGQANGNYVLNRNFILALIAYRTHCMWYRLMIPWFVLQHVTVGSRLRMPMLTILQDSHFQIKNIFLCQVVFAEQCLQRKDCQGPRVYKKIWENCMQSEYILDIEKFGGHQESKTVNNEADCMSFLYSCGLFHFVSLHNRCEDSLHVNT